MRSCCEKRSSTISALQLAESRFSRDGSLFHNPALLPQDIENRPDQLVSGSNERCRGLNEVCALFGLNNAAHGIIGFPLG
jgi:hypothetical protein